MFSEKRFAGKFGNYVTAALDEKISIRWQILLYQKVNYFLKHGDHQSSIPLSQFGCLVHFPRTMVSFPAVFHEKSVSSPLLILL